MAVKVSVVVPVYNPGHHIDDLIASVLRQSLPRDEYEVIFVDDGSTDGTGERLDALAAEHEHLTSLHIPNSGWPGKPRNVGIDAARGKYVFFIDNDDFIGDEALERLYDFAERNGSDVVTGKIVGRGRVIPREIFRKDVERAKLVDGFPLTMLTPHKLFRRAFLDEHGIRFPEGRRRLEDHLFVMAAYLKADVLSILADYPCYYWVGRADETNASSNRFDPRGYYDNLREVLDLVAANTEPGAFRDTLMRHRYRGKILGRMGRKRLFAYPPEYRAELHAELQRLVREDRWSEGVAAGLPMTLRVRARLLRDAGLPELERLAEVEGSLQAEVQLTSATPLEDGRLRLRLRSRLRYADGTEVAYRRDGDRLLWELPPALTDLPHVTAEDRDSTRALRRSKTSVLLRSVADKQEFLLPASSTTTETVAGELVSVTVVTEVTVDALTAAAGSPLPTGEWNVIGRIGSCGWDAFAPVVGPLAGDARLPGAVVGDPAVAVAARWSPKGHRLRILVDPSGSLPAGVDVYVDAPAAASPGRPDDKAAIGDRLQDLVSADLRAFVRRHPRLQGVARSLRDRTSRSRD